MNTESTTTEKKPRREFTREVRVKITPDEERAYGQKLADGRADRRALDDKRKATNKDYGGQLAQIDAELDRLTAAIRDKEELRPVRVYEEWRAGVIEVRRVDTEEVIDTKIPTLSEQQANSQDSLFAESDLDPPQGDVTGGETDSTEQQPIEESAVDGVARIIDEGFAEARVLDEEDFGGAAARKAGKLELVRSATGGEVAHMPDDEEGEGEAPAEEPVEPRKAAKKSRGGNKPKAKR